MKSIWQGEKVRLQALEPEDWEIFSMWNEDTEMARLAYFIPFPKSNEAERKRVLEEALKKPENDQFNFAIENQAGQLVGTINTHTCDPRNGTFRYGIVVAREHRRKGYARDAIRLVLRYFFEELRYQKVNVEVYVFNEASIQLHQRQGFRQEGRLCSMVFTNGRFYDSLIFGLTAAEFHQNTL